MGLDEERTAKEGLKVPSWRPKDQPWATNWHLHMRNEQVSPLCRMCNESDETIAHVVSECPKLAQT